MHSVSSKTRCLAILAILGVCACDEPDEPRKAGPSPPSAKKDRAPPENTEPELPPHLGAFEGRAQLRARLSVREIDEAERKGKEPPEAPDESMRIALELDVDPESLSGQAELGEDPVGAFGSVDGKTLRVTFRGDEISGTWLGRFESGSDGPRYLGTVRISVTTMEQKKATTRSWEGDLALNKVN